MLYQGFFLFFVRKSLRNGTLDFSLKKEESSVLKTNKISMKSAITVKETFEKFLTVKKSVGLSNKTLKSYREHFCSLEKILDTSIEMSTVSKEYFSSAVAVLRDRELPHFFYSVKVQKSVSMYILWPSVFPSRFLDCDYIVLLLVHKCSWGIVQILIHLFMHCCT